MVDIQLQSTITCPQCGFRQQETMPTDSCQFLYQCRSCQAVLRPQQDDCCVFCSYGDVVCPPKQLEATGGASPDCCA